MSAVAGIRATVIIARREIERFLSSPARIGAAVGTPLLLWLFVGAGFSGGFRPGALDETSYAAFLLPGMMTLVAVFASVFSSIALIEEREEGWLRGVLVSPAPRWSIAVGKTLGGGATSFAQAAILLPVALPFGVSVTPTSAATVLVALAATSLAVTALGLALAWYSPTTGSFHAIMNLVLMPLWLLSGAFFPPGDTAPWLGAIMRLNPLTWCTEAIRAPLLSASGSPSLLPPLAFAAAMLAAAVFVMRGPLRRGG